MSIGAIKYPIIIALIPNTKEAIPILVIRLSPLFIFYLCWNKVINV